MTPGEFGRFTSAREILSRLDDSLQKLRDAGYSPKPGSRFLVIREEFRRFERAASNPLSPFELDGTVLSQGLVDAFELGIIAECQTILAGHPKEVEEMLSGSVLPEDDSLTRPRDLQFQLFVAANLGLMGVPVRLEEPDMRIDYGGMTLGVAAKRIQSESSLEKRLKEANKQIQAQGLNGFIALGLEQIALNRRLRVVAAGPEALSDVGDTLGGRALEAIRPIVEKTRTPSTIGYLVWVVIPAVFPRHLSIGFSSFYGGIYVAPRGHPCSEIAEAICKMVPPHYF
jgi:hypothetical protein